MNRYASLAYLGLTIYTVAILIVICSPSPWLTGGMTVAMLAVWLIYGILATAWIQWHQQMRWGAGLFYLYMARMFWR